MPLLSCFRGNSQKETFPVIDFSHGNLLTVPPEIYDHAVSLEELYLDGNQLQELPKVGGQPFLYRHYFATPAKLFFLPAFSIAHLLF